MQQEARVKLNVSTGGIYIDKGLVDLTSRGLVMPTRSVKLPLGISLYYLAALLREMFLLVGMRV